MWILVFLKGAEVLWRLLIARAIVKELGFTHFPMVDAKGDMMEDTYLSPLKNINMDNLILVGYIVFLGLSVSDSILCKNIVSSLWTQI